jgi:hypothetical protein
LLGTLAACGPSGSAAGPTTPPTTITTHLTASLPPAPAAPAVAKTASCPYLTASFVQDANGQHVSSVRISDDASQPHPTCFFYRPDGHLQVTVRVYVGDPQVAESIVNQAAPVSTSDPATDPPGWQGGFQSGDYNGMNNPTGNAVYAVHKGADAVVVSVNQAQSIKARRIADQAITGLGF